MTSDILWKYLLMFCVDRFNVLGITEKQTLHSAAFCYNVNYMADSAKSVLGCKSLERCIHICFQQFIQHFGYFCRAICNTVRLKIIFRIASVLYFCVSLFAFVDVQVKVNNELATGTGPNKKVAKRNAAEAMLLQLGYKASTVPQNTNEVQALFLLLTAAYISYSRLCISATPHLF